MIFQGQHRVHWPVSERIYAVLERISMRRMVRHVEAWELARRMANKWSRRPGNVIGSMARLGAGHWWKGEFLHDRMTMIEAINECVAENRLASDIETYSPYLKALWELQKLENEVSGNRKLLKRLKESLNEHCDNRTTA